MIEHDLCSTIVNIDYSAVAIKMQKECAEPSSLKATPDRLLHMLRVCSWGIKVGRSFYRI